MPNSHPSPHHQLAPMSLHVLVLFFQIAYEIHGVNLAPIMHNLVSQIPYRIYSKCY